VLLSDAQQERYARHLLLDGIGGEGQERLLRARVRVHGTGPAARACAFYLAASGIGALAVEDGSELSGVSPDLRLLGRTDEVDLELAPGDGASGAAEAAAAGCWQALEAVRALAGSP
jgi:hypothetical protein